MGWSCAYIQPYYGEFILTKIDIVYTFIPFSSTDSIGSSDSRRMTAICQYFWSSDITANNTWWRNDLEMLSLLLALCMGNCLTLSIWFTWPSGTWFQKIMCPAKIFMCPANICTSPAKLMYTAEKISTRPDWKITCPVGHVTTKVYVPWDKIYMPRACGHALLTNPVHQWIPLKGPLSAKLEGYHPSLKNKIFLLVASPMNLWLLWWPSRESSMFMVS